MAAFVAWQVVSSMKNGQQSQNLLLKVDQHSTFRNTFLQPAKNVFVAGQVDRARWKTGNIDEDIDIAIFLGHFCPRGKGAWGLALCEAPTQKEQQKGQPQYLETSRPTKTCNETMLRDKLRVSVSRISPPIGKCKQRVKRRHEARVYCGLVSSLEMRLTRNRISRAILDGGCVIMLCEN